MGSEMCIRDSPHGRHRSLIEQERTRRTLGIWHAMHVDAERTAAQTAGLCCLVRLLKGTDRHKEHGADSRTGHNMQKPHGLGNTHARQPSPHAGSLPSVSPVNPRVGFSMRLPASTAPLLTVLYFYFFCSFPGFAKSFGARCRAEIANSSPRALASWLPSKPIWALFWPRRWPCVS